jgi:predicted nucleotidyltransferase
MKESQPLLPLLRSRVQGDLLALLYLHPEQDYSLREAARLIGASPKAVHDEASRLVDTGFVTDSRRGASRLIRAVTDSPISRPLTDLLMVTYGPLPVLTDMLSGVEGVDQAFIFGSWAARYQGEIGPVPNDVDVLVIGNPDRDDLYDIAEEARHRLGREVNPRVISVATWASSPAPNDPFLKHVRSRPLVELKVRSA